MDTFIQSLEISTTIHSPPTSHSLTLSSSLRLRHDYPNLVTLYEHRPYISLHTCTGVYQRTQSCNEYTIRANVL